MAIFKKEQVKANITNAGHIYIPEKSLTKVSEKAKKDDTGKVDYSKHDVYPHCTKKDMARGLYRSFGLITGVVDKYVDHIIGPGFHVKSKNKRAEKIIQDYIVEQSLPLVLKPAFKEAITTGDGPLEIQSNKKGIPNKFETINSETFYIDKDEKGYKQILPNSREEPVSFSNDEIALFQVNKMPGKMYGLGVISPAMSIIDNYLKSDKDMHKLIERKANSPIHVKIGDAANKIIPTQEDVNAYGSKLHYMRNQTEWATDPYVDMKVLDFGNVGEKFSAVMESDFSLMLYAFQMPEVVLGTGNIPEGLAKVQLDIWDRTVQSIREDFEKVIEQNIFKKILEANNIQAQVDIIWTKPGEQAKTEEIIRITEILKLMDLDYNLRLGMERRLAELMGIDYKQQEDEERKNEEEARQPQVPGQNEKPPEKPEESFCGCEIQEGEQIPFILQEARTVQEWVGYDYQQHQAYINEFIDSDEFVHRENYKTFQYVPGSGQTKWKEVTNSYSLADELSEKQVGKLRNVLKFNLKNNSRMSEIINDIQKEVAPGELEVNVPDKLDKDGNVVRKGYTRKIPERTRSVNLARTETIRASNQGALRQFRADDINEVQWVSAYSGRTCAYCEAQNGKIMNIKDANEGIPVHSQCRCSYVPVIRG